MCGVLGFVRQATQQDYLSKQSLLKGIDTLSHRGPDGSGMYVDSNVGLAHVRLSVLDLTEAGAQPFKSSSDRFIISYNGEVYNFKALADELGINDLESGTDTEVIIRSFEILGTALFAKLNGMFAFALFDQQSRRMWLVRDRLGIKSIYYKQTQDAFWFSSEIKGIFAMEEESSAKYLNYEGIHEWSYFGSSLGEKTLFFGVQRLLPGHYLQIDTETLEIQQHCYWSIPQFLTTNTQNIKHTQPLLIEKTRVLLENAVKRQLVSDVPIGVFLSGGVDSSAITAFATKHYREQLTTYSVAFDFDSSADELPMARNVAKIFNTKHHELEISGANVADVVEKMVIHHDAPFSDAANIPLFLLCQEIKGQTKVVLQGDGGDEVFGGYQRYRTLAHLKKMKLLALFGRFFNSLTVKNIKHYQRRRYMNALLAQDDATMVALLLTVEEETDSPLLIFSHDFQQQFKKQDPFARYHQIEQLVQHQNVVDRMFSIDHAIILPDVFLEKVDKSSMAASIEVRVPFLDNELVDFCLSLSHTWKVKGGKQKWLLKKALEGIVPNEVLYGKKRGFGVPYGYWIRSSLLPLLQDHMSSFNEDHKNILNVRYITDILDEHRACRRDHGFLLWKVLNFVIWANQNQVIFNDR